MRFKIDQTALAIAARHAKAAVSTGKHAVAPLTGIRITADSNQTVSLVGMSIDQTVERIVPAEVTVPGQGLVSGIEFASLVAQFPAGDVEVAVRGQNLVLTAGDLNYELKLAIVTDFPEVSRPADLGATQMAVLPEGAVAEIEALTAFAVSSAPSRPALCGVHLLGRGSSLRAVGTDAHKLAMVEMDVAASKALDSIIPPAVLKHAAALDGAVTLFAGSGFVFFVSSSGSVVANVIDASFPDLSGIIPNVAAMPTQRVVNRAALANALDRLQVVSSERRSETSFVVSRVTLDLDADRVSLSGSRSDVGGGAEPLPVLAGDAGASVGMHLNGNLLGQCLKHLPGERVRLHATSAERSLVLQMEGSTRVTMLCVPLSTLQAAPVAVAV
jgi:DNA polymerase-3 subunit beta